MWWRYAKPGDKVVCVNDEWHETAGPTYQYSNGLPTVGSVYLIEDFCPHPFSEVMHLSIAKFPEAWFECGKFKPLQSTDKGMSILRGILNGQPVLEDA